jgi:cytochrome b561
MAGTSKGYSRLQIRLHWAVFVLVVIQYVFHEAIAEAWEVIEEAAETGMAATAEPGFDPLVPLHVAGGIAIAVLALWRIGLRLVHGAPPPPEGTPPGMARLAGVVHGALYALILALPASGAAAWFGGIEAAADVHEVLRGLLIVLVAGHVGAALWHQFVRRDAILGRMR